MALPLTITRKSTGDVVKIALRVGASTHIVAESYVAARFGLTSTESVKDILDSNSGECVLPVEVEGQKQWLLSAQQPYFLKTTGDCLTIPAEILTENVVCISSSSDYSDCSSPRPSSIHIPDDVIPETPTKEYRVSALDRFLNLTGTSELSGFLKRRSWVVKQVDALPASYNGDIVFELPPVTGYNGRGHFLKGMDRGMDCYSWTRIIRTSAGISPKKQFAVGKVQCTGSLECQNDACDYFRDKRSRNNSSWVGKSMVSRVHAVGQNVPEGGVECGFCRKPPFCVNDCAAKMFFIYPRPDVGSLMWPHMSRLAIHMGSHNHSPRQAFSRDSMKKVYQILEVECAANPGATPSRMRNVTAGKLLGYLHPETAQDLSTDEEREIWESLQVISTPAKFAQVLRSVKDMKPDSCELDCIIRMQKNIRFPFIQRFLYPGQCHESERCHIFKMSTKGSGSGVDLLRRMLPGGTLHGSWVMFDVMHRCTKGWKTLSAHVYDHNFRALSTIFTCELLAEDSHALEKAWRLMIEVAKDNGVEEIYIHGFMADNAEAGWIAVRRVFFEGFTYPERERSDAFHFRQSFHRHSMEGIQENKREEHFLLWEKLRNATSYVHAYRISEEIRSWWKAGNCVPGKLKMLEGWMAWWVVRWRQWGSSIRLKLGARESALMPNTTGAESVHASMRASQPRKKVTVVEACETDQNRAASQIAAYISYENGQTRGKGPTIFELAFRNSDAVGSPRAYEDALNLLLSSNDTFDLLRSHPLNGDIQTKSFKRKEPSFVGISPQDSHRHDQVLRTTPNTRGFKRRNLDFSTPTGSDPRPILGQNNPQQESILLSEDSTSSDEVELIQTPRRPPTRSNPSPVAHNPSGNFDQYQLSPVSEKQVAFGEWHFRRTSRLGAGPVCNASMRGCASAREDCKNHIKKIGFKNPLGVIGVAIQGERIVAGAPMKSLIWFCPNNECHKRSPRRYVSPLPEIPLSMPVALGTKPCLDEVRFLLTKGFNILGRPRYAQEIPDGIPCAPAIPGPLDLRIDLNAFPETIFMNNPNHRHRTRNGRVSRQRLGETVEQEKRVLASNNEEMRVIRGQDVLTGIGFGKQILIATHESDGRIPRKYWIQICCFPCCSCDDFYRRHTRGKAYMSCKHLFWVYKNVFRLDLDSNMIVRQPVLTIGEVQDLLARWSGM